MYTIEIHHLFKQLFNAFRQYNVWRNEERDATLVRKITSKFIYIFFQLFLVISVLLGGLFSKDKIESVFLIDVAISSSVTSVKLLYILWKEKEICSFIQAIGVHTVSDYEEFKKFNGKVNFLMKFAYSLFWFMIFNCVALIIFSLPLFSNERRLPFNIWLPLDWKNNLYVYCIAFALVVMGMIVCVMASTLSGYIWYLMWNCAIKYQILGNKFRNMFCAKPACRERKFPKVQEENIFLQYFIGLIKDHKNVEETVDRFKSCFEILFFVQITTSAICICGSVYTLAFGSNDATLVQSVFYVLVLLYNTFDIFMMMYLGNEIKLSSDQLSYCLFESNWLERSEVSKKCMIILTEVLKNPQELFIGMLYPLNLETFTSIINLAYSMFNILKTLN